MANKPYGVMDSGFRLDDDLTVIEHLGGSRKVDLYLCRSTLQKGHVACKVLRSHYTIDFSSLEAVLHEGEILLEMHHPNVIEGYRIELEPFPRVVMEYLGGQTVRDIFFQGNWDAFDVGDFVDVAAQVCDALSYVHSRGYVHLDVKPSNLMYDDGHVTLFDFSVAEPFDPEEGLRNNAGTTDYMAPEQTFRRRISYATDVFGIGVVFYELLTGGELPYESVRIEDEDETNGYRRELDYEKSVLPPSHHNPEVPSNLDEVALKAVDPDPDLRFENPEQFRRTLEDFFQ